MIKDLDVPLITLHLAILTYRRIQLDSSIKNILVLSNSYKEAGDMKQYEVALNEARTLLKRVIDIDEQARKIEEACTEIVQSLYSNPKTVKEDESNEEDELTTVIESLQ